MEYDLAGYVSTLVNKIQTVNQSIDRFGKRNWEGFGSEGYCWRCSKVFGDPENDLEPGTEQRHHIVPDSEGGTSRKDNLALLCANCHAVIHKFYLPYAQIGKGRTQTDSGRLVGNFDEGVEITKLLEENQDHTSHCPKCNIPGTVEGVSEGYWDGEGMLILLACPRCDRKFADPYIGTRTAPEMNRASQICTALQHSLGTVGGRLDEEAKKNRDDFFQEFMDRIRDADSELQYRKIIMERTGSSESELEEIETSFWKIFSAKPEIVDLLQRAAALQEKHQTQR